jgi:Rrf2 family protein
MMLELAKLHMDAAVSLGVIAKNTGISRRYLDQLATSLKSAGLIRATSGKGGGYQLMREAGGIRLGEIIEAAIGPINIVDCIAEPNVCDRADCCECRSVYALINRRITDVLNELSLGELALSGTGVDALFRSKDSD